MVFLQLGLPAAFTYYAGRGETRGLASKSLVLTMALSGVAVAALVVVVPLLQGDALEGFAPGQVALAFLALPLALNATLTTGIVIGRKRIAAFSVIGVVSPIVALVLIVLLLGVLGVGVVGAIVVFVVGAAIQAIGLFITAARPEPDEPARSDVGYRKLFAYGLPTWVGSLTTFFSYRVDVFLVPPSSSPTHPDPSATTASPWALPSWCSSCRTRWRRCSCRRSPGLLAMSPTCTSPGWRGSPCSSPGPPR